MNHATSEDCPCCHRCLSPGEDTDRALVAAFLSGITAHATDVPHRAALCEHHAALGAEAEAFLGACGADVRGKPLRCPRCGGPAARVVQTGELSCFAQCEEKLPAMARRIALEELTAKLARVLVDGVPADIGFTLVLAEYEGVGGMAYASTVEREDAMSMLRELLDKMTLEGPRKAGA